MEGDMMKGKFTRKDNNKVLTTTRVLEGGELVQVSRSTCVFVDKMQDANLSSVSVSPHTQSYSYEGVDAKRIFKKQ